MRLIPSRTFDCEGAAAVVSSNIWSRLGERMRRRTKKRNGPRAASRPNWDKDEHFLMSSLESKSYPASQSQ
jgi:hypothetical protein